MSRQQGERLCREESTQHQDGLGDGVCSQNQRLFDPRHPIGIRLRQGIGDLQQTMSICVGFEHGDDLAVGSMAPHNGKIMVQCIHIDAGSNSIHDGLFLP